MSNSQRYSTSKVVRRVCNHGTILFRGVWYFSELIPRAVRVETPPLICFKPNCCPKNLITRGLRSRTMVLRARRIALLPMGFKIAQIPTKCLKLGNVFTGPIIAKFLYVYKVLRPIWNRFKLAPWIVQYKTEWNNIRFPISPQISKLNSKKMLRMIQKKHFQNRKYFPESIRA